MNEQAIFEAALEIEDVGKRRNFIEKACAGDAALRARVEGLFRSHESAGSFLEIPAVGPAKAETSRPVDRTQDFTPRSDSGEANEKEEDRELALSYLQPSTKPGSLGVLGHYEVLQILGQGGFGIVLKAFDEKLHRLVAIKMMSPQLAATSPPRKRFQREARAAAQIKHENIVQIYSVEEQPLPYLVMEYVEGQTLAQKLDGNGPLETSEVLHFARQIACGLAAAHDKNHIHRDIKPGNILIEQGAEQKLKITDFGLARAVDDASMTRTGMIAGTPMYMAPEQAMGKDLDHRTDLFSFGSVMYQMACGRPPFRAPTTIAVLRRVAEDTPRPLKEILPEIPAWLVTIINKLLQKNPEERYQSAREVADLLARCQTEMQQTGKVTCVPKEALTPAAIEARPMRQEAKAKAGTKIHLGIWLAGFAMGATIIALVASQFFGGGGQQTNSQKQPKTDHAEKESVTKPYSADTDRALAEWVLSIGGTVRLEGVPAEIEVLSDLPQKPFALSEVNLDANPRLVDSEFTRFTTAKRLRRLYLANTPLTDDIAPELAKCVNLEELSLHGAKVSNATFAACKQLSKLRTLTISGKINAALSELKDCQGLDYLSLSMSDVADDGLSDLQELKNLTKLELKLTKVTDTGLETLKELRGLTSLDLSQTPVTKAGVEKLQRSLPECKITWDGGVIEPNPIEAAKPIISALLKSGVVLEFVDPSRDRHRKPKTIDEITSDDRLAALHINETAAANAEAVAFLARITSDLWRKDSGPRALHLSGKVSSERLQELLAIPSLHVANGMYLGIVDTPYSDSTLAGLNQFTDLVHLYLPHRSVSDDLLKRIVEAMPKLEVLSLDHSNVTNTGLIVLRNRPLRILQLQGCTQIDDVAADHIAAIPTLELLLLNATNITDAGLAKLTTLTKLKTINVNGAKVTEAGVKKLAASLPNCQITWAGGVIEPAPNAERLAAEFVLNAGGEVTLQMPDGSHVPSIRKIADLPATSFHLFLANIPACQFGDEELKLFKDLAELRVLRMPGNATISDVGISYLANLKKLGVLNIRLSKVTAESLGKLRPFPELLGVQVSGGVTDDMLRKLTVIWPNVSSFDIDLGEAQITEQGFEELTKFEGLTNLLFTNWSTGDSRLISSARVSVLKAAKKLRILSFGHLSLDDAGLQQVGELNNLEHLTMSHGRLPEGGFAHLRGLKSLTKLDLYASTINDAALKEIGALPKLVDLILHSTPISDVGLEHLHGLKSLHAVHLSATKVSAVGVKKLAAALPQCWISWDGGTIEGTSPMYLAKPILGGLLKAGVVIETVEPFHSGRGRPASIDALKPTEYIQAIGIDQKAAANPEVVDLLRQLPIEAWTTSAAGRAVYLSGDNKPEQFRGILAIESLHSIFQLYMGDQSAPPQPDSSFADLAKFTELQHLYFPPSCVSDEVLKSVAAMPRLTALGLSNANVTSNGLAALKDLPLQVLILQSCKHVDAAAGEHLTLLTDLRQLELNATSINDETLTKLVTLSKLATLNVAGTKVTEPGLKKLAASLPNCRITWDGGVIEPNPKPSPEK